MLGVCAGIPWTANSTPQAPQPGAPGPLPLPGVDYDYRLTIKLSPVHTYAWDGNDLGSPYLRDVMTHSAFREQQPWGPTTDAHEGLHRIHGDANASTSNRENFVYVEQGQGAFILEPKTKRDAVPDRVPAGARQLTERYQFYLIEKAAFWTEMLYLFDEWGAYVGNGRVGVELARRGWYQAANYARDEVDGMVDFLYFSSAGMLALKQLEPNYFHGNEQIKAVFALLAESTMRWYSEGIRVPAFQGFHGEALMAHFTSSPENAAIRAMLREWYGPVWTQRVFGFS